MPAHAESRPAVPFKEHGAARETAGLGFNRGNGERFDGAILISIAR